MKELMIDMHPAGEPWCEQYGDPTLMSIRIGEVYDGRLHYSSVLVSRENALILQAAQSMYEALRMDEDYITPATDAVKAAMYALDKAEGEPMGTRWEAYLASKKRQPADTGKE